MRTVDYQQRIVECSQKASSVPNAQARLVWKRMEEFWRKRAVAPKPTRTFKELSFLSEAPPQPGEIR